MVPCMVRATCTGPSCDRGSRRNKLCAAHLDQLARGDGLHPIPEPSSTLVEGWPFCSRCDRWRPTEDFGWDTVRKTWKRVCRPCVAEGMRGYNTRNAAAIRLRVTLRRWGIDEGRYRSLFERQRHLCAICKRPSTKRGYKLALDHDHATGLVRGLLCQDCNMGLGQFHDDPKRLRAAARYLERGGVLGEDAFYVDPDGDYQLTIPLDGEEGAVT